MKRALAVVFRLLLVALILVGVKTAPALSDGPANTAIAIQPLHLEHTAATGTRVSGKFRVLNQSAAPLDIVMELSGYIPRKGVDGAIELTEDPAHSVLSWNDFFPVTQNVSARGQQDIFYHFDVPKNALPGDYYGAIIARTNDPSVQVGVASLVLITVLGEPGALHYGASATSDDIPSFADSPPVSLRAVVQNTGNVHIKASYQVRITNALGGGEVARLKTDPADNVLAESARQFSLKWDPASGLIPTIGQFRVAQQISWNETETINLPTATVTVLPLAWLAKVAAALLAICLIGWLTLRAYTRALLAANAQNNDQANGSRRRRGRR